MVFNVLSHFHMGIQRCRIHFKACFGGRALFQLLEVRLFFFHRKVRARPDKDGPLKSSWSVWRPQVVWTLTVGEDLMKLKEVLREGEEMD